jgi:hypothetical protein
MLKRTLFAIIVAAITFGTGLGTAALALTRQQSTQKEYLLHEESFGGWSYRAMEEDRSSGLLQVDAPRVTMSIETTLRGREYLADLLAQQKSAGEQLFQTQSSLSGVIIPKTPVAPEQLTDFATRQGITIKAYTLIAKAANGEIVTIFGAPEGQQISPKHNFDDMVKGIETNQQTTLHFQGVVAIDAEMDKAAFDRIGQDSTILDVDLTTALALEDLARAKQIDPSRVEIMPAPLYWANVETS